MLHWPFKELSLRLAEREEARIVVATDPDADRLAVAEQNDKYYIINTLSSKM